MESQSNESPALWPCVAVLCSGIIASGIFFGLRNTSPAPSATSETRTDLPAPSSHSSATDLPAPTRTATGTEDTQGVVVYVTRTGKKYHWRSCSSLRKSKIPMSLSEARGQFGPCSRCQPPL
jgi:hypothetical protein